MVKKTILAAFAASLVVLGVPAVASAYGACHVGYTHAGPNGVYHTGETVARGPGGVYAGGRTTAYGGTEYRGVSSTNAAYGGATYSAHYSTGGSSGYYYAPGYHGAATTSYGYVR